MTKIYSSSIGPGLVQLRQKQSGYELISAGKIFGKCSQQQVEVIVADYGITRALNECIGSIDPVARITEIYQLIQTGSFAKTKSEAKQVPLSTRQRLILKNTKKNGEITASAAQKLCRGVSRMTVYRELNFLTQIRLLQQVGSGRGAHYLVSSSLTVDSRITQLAIEYKNLLTAASPEIRYDFELEDIVELIYTNNKLEGIEIQFGDTQAVVRDYYARLKRKKNPAARELFILDHVQTFQRLRETATSPLTVQLICELHASMMAHDPAAGFVRGKLRDTDSYAQGIDTEYLDYRKIEIELTDFIQAWGLLEKSDFNTGRLSELLGIFLYIHPFQDGNGRLARLLLSRYLLISDQPTIAFSVTKRFDFLRAAYHANRGEIGPLRQLIQDALLGKLRDRIRRLETMI